MKPPIPAERGSLKGHGGNTLADLFDGSTETAGDRQLTIPASDAPISTHALRL
jgi:hypothetical protein